MACETISACDLASMRAAVEATLPDTAAIYRNTPVDDSQGGQTASWATTGSVACQVTPRGGQREEPEGGRPMAETWWTVQVPHGTSLLVKDRLVISSKTYEILALDDGRSHAVTLNATCRRLD